MPTPDRTAQFDQAHAASQEALGILLTAGAGEVVLAPVTPWLAALVIELIHAVQHNTATCCLHLAQAGAAPQVMYAAAWRRWHLVCLDCLPGLEPTPGESHRCDQCDQIATRLYNSTANAGPILLQIGLCAPCSDHAGPPPAPGHR